MDVLNWSVKHPAPPLEGSNEFRHVVPATDRSSGLQAQNQSY